MLFLDCSYYCVLEASEVGSVWVGVHNWDVRGLFKYESALTVESVQPEAAGLHCPPCCSIGRKAGPTLEQHKVLFEFRELCSVVLNEPWLHLHVLSLLVELEAFSLIQEENTVRGEKQLPICESETEKILHSDGKITCSTDTEPLCLNSFFLLSKGVWQHHYLLSWSGITTRVVTWLAECNHHQLHLAEVEKLTYDKREYVEILDFEWTLQLQYLLHLHLHLCSHRTKTTGCLFACI